MSKDKPVHLLSPAQEKEVVAAIKRAENKTSGEIRVHLEAHTDEPNLDHAKKIFEEAGMTDTALRNGVLIYLAINDHQFSILGDKGIDEKVPDDFWENIRNEMQTHFRAGRFTEGLVQGIDQAGKALQAYFPLQDGDINELPDEISKS